MINIIVKSNKTYETNSIFPNVDWYDEDNYVIDETTEEGKVLAQKIIENYPYYELVIENNKVVDVVLTERPPEPLPEPEPTLDDYLLDLDFRLSNIELGL